jgi:hypothetical protein
VPSSGDRQFTYFKVECAKNRLGWGRERGSKGNYGAVKDPKGAVISAESSREGSAGPGNPGLTKNEAKNSSNTVLLMNLILYQHHFF